MSRIATKWIQDAAVTKDKLNADVGGDGITGGAGAALDVVSDSTGGANLAKVINVSANGVAVKIDDATIGENGSNQLHVKDGGIDTTQLANDAVDETKIDLSKTYDYSSGGGTVQVSTPVNDTDAANKSYVDAVAEGLDVKDSVVALSNVNKAISGTTTIDGIAVVADDRVLLTNQDDAKENGIWLVKAGAWVRPDDFAVGASVAGAFCFVEEGGSYAESGWVCTSDTGSDVVGTNSLAFTQFTGMAQISAGAGLTKTGNTIDVIGNNTGGIQVNADDIELNVDDVTIEISGSGPGTVRVKDGGIDENKLNASVAGNGLTGGGGSVLDVDPAQLVKGGDAEIDGDTIDIDYTPTNYTPSTTPPEVTSVDELTAHLAGIDDAIAGISTENIKQEMHLVTAGDVTAGYFSLSQSPVNAQSVRVTPVSGPGQINKQCVGATGATPDYDVLNTTELHINNNGAATGLSGHIAQNDVLIIRYQY